MISHLQFLASVLGALLLLWGAVQALWVFDWVWWRPKRIERALRKQGIKGSAYRFLFGDAMDEKRMIRDARSKPMPLSHDIVPRVAPLIHRAMGTYGPMSLTWVGPRPRVTITDPQLIKEALLNKSGNLVRLKSAPTRMSLTAGLVRHEGRKWAKHRRIVSPAFHLNKLKNMLPAFTASCTDMIDRWSMLMGSQDSCELDVHHEFQILTADVISRSAFGSHYEEGRRIFQLQREQAELVSQASYKLNIPGYRFLPLKQNTRMKHICAEANSILRGMTMKREKEMKLGAAPTDDLLGMLMESNAKSIRDDIGSSNKGLTIDEVIEECKLFYFAGQDTTNALLSWTMLCLSLHPVWQERSREEAIRVFGKNCAINFDGLNQLQTMDMVLHEVLRLYPPGIYISRVTAEKTELGRFTFPPGVQLLMPTVILHRDPEHWGEDANDFNPGRFSQGVPRATKTQHRAFFPFGWGPRVCIGQNFAAMEAKMALAMILPNFSFQLAPSYVHAPCTVITLQPQHGAQIILHRLNGC